MQASWGLSVFWEGSFENENGGGEGEREEGRDRGRGDTCSLGHGLKGTHYEYRSCACGFDLRSR